MASIDDNPTRVPEPGRYNRAGLPVGERTQLKRPDSLDTSFLKVLENRRSAELFDPVDFCELSTWLFYCCSTQAVKSDDPNRQHRYVASFGALHPHHLLLGAPDGRWVAYLPDTHCIASLDVDKRTAEELRQKALLHHNSPDATLVVLLADRDLVCTYYQNAYGLLLRDAGVLLGHAQLVAAALRLAFRILGTTGSPEALGLIRNGLSFTPVATGLAWVGRQAVSDQ